MIYTIFNSLTKVKNKANSNPIQTQTNPILANYKAWQSQTKPIQSRSKPITNGVSQEVQIIFDLAVGMR
jgi:hypothetical protein